MSRTDPQVHIRLDDKKGAQRRADEDYRGNLTAYLNALVKADINDPAHSFTRLAKATKQAEAHYKKLKSRKSKEHQANRKK